MSACNASRLRAVSLSVSPLVRLEVVAEILITSALKRNAASSKEVRVRVLGSTKKFTSVFAAQCRHLLISRVPDLFKRVGGLENEIDFVGRQLAQAE